MTSALPTTVVNMTAPRTANVPISSAIAPADDDDVTSAGDVIAAGSVTSPAAAMATKPRCRFRNACTRARNVDVVSIHVQRHGRELGKKIGRDQVSGNILD